MWRCDAATKSDVAHKIGHTKSSDISEIFFVECFIFFLTLGTVDVFYA